MIKLKLYQYILLTIHLQPHRGLMDHKTLGVYEYDEKLKNSRTTAFLVKKA